MKKASFLSVVFSLLLTALIYGQQQGAFVRVVDVGAGLCCVVALPDNHYMIYDAGNWEDKGKSAISAIWEIIPENAAIDLMVLSHSDADHHTAVPAICERYKVRRIIRDGLPSASKTWEQSNEAIQAEVENDGCQDLNLKDVDVKPGTQYKLGDAMVTYVCGFYELPEDWPQLKKNEAINARSVIVRLEYAGKSVLFSGDTVGRHIGDPEETCIAAERFMVSNASQVPIHSELLVAPHHGADNASSMAWIQAVAPEYVIFSAGHKYEHPRQVVAERYLKNGVALVHLFRTDLGDNEGGEEWDYGSSEDGHTAGTGDVGVWIKPDGRLTVSYLVDKSVAAGDSAQPTIQPSTDNRYRPPAGRWRPFRRYRSR